MMPTELYLVVQYSSDKVRSEAYKNSIILSDWDEVKNAVFKYWKAAKIIRLKKDSNEDEDSATYLYHNSQKTIKVGVFLENGEYKASYEKYTDFEYLISKQEMIDDLED